MDVDLYIRKKLSTLLVRYSVARNILRGKVCFAYFYAFFAEQHEIAIYKVVTN